MGATLDKHVCVVNKPVCVLCRIHTKCDSGHIKRLSRIGRKETQDQVELQAKYLETHDLNQDQPVQEVVVSILDALLYVRERGLERHICKGLPVMCRRIPKEAGCYSRSGRARSGEGNPRGSAT